MPAPPSIMYPSASVSLMQQSPHDPHPQTPTRRRSIRRSSLCLRPHPPEDLCPSPKSDCRAGSYRPTGALHCSVRRATIRHLPTSGEATYIFVTALLTALTCFSRGWPWWRSRERRSSRPASTSPQSSSAPAHQWLSRWGYHSPLFLMRQLPKYGNCV